MSLLLDRGLFTPVFYAFAISNAARGGEPPRDLTGVTGRLCGCVRVGGKLWLACPRQSGNRFAVRPTVLLQSRPEKYGAQTSGPLFVRLNADINPVLPLGRRLSLAGVSGGGWFG